MAFPIHHTQRKTQALILKKLIFNGPFLLKKWEPQQCVVLEKNPLYWNYKFITYNEIEIKIIKNSATAALMFQRG
ncbi:hypothetical protein CLAVI_000817 [Candidatus Clavichlamydia salmonicola]|nr:hypothetical protein [Candidatus Clavichlamydia salmonicola]